VIRSLSSFTFLFLCSLFFATYIPVRSNTANEFLSTLNKQFKEQEKKASLVISENPELVRAWSNRGDMRLFLGNFEGARSDYEKMIQLDPSLEVSHWRLGIAYFYLKEYDKAARQFEIYHNYDAIDRENGIWRFMSQFKSKGLRTAREGLLIYKKDDRPPYPLLYEMFAGRLKPDEVFTEIEKVNYPENYRNRVLFHATLYVGIYLELVDGNKEMAGNLLRKAFENKYGRATGTYMWQVARLHYFQLLARSEPGTQKPFAGRK
jgi:lipoprotein NlpI